MPDKDKLVIWPIYFDAGRTRGEGRMVSLQDAIKEPTLDITITAAIKSGFKPEIEREKKHPKVWHETEASGRILVPKNGPKSAILRQIARSLKGKRGREGDIGRKSPQR
ncbi:MAG: signal recognition particle protein Srp19 [Methanothrix sp.]|nr:signal recognition particle protein Srp19 [Methanothrix sp.]